MMDSFSLSLSLSLSLASTPCETSNYFKFTAPLSQAPKTSILLLNTKAKISTECVPACKKKISIKKECYNRTRISCKMTGRKKITQAGNSS